YVHRRTSSIFSLLSQRPPSQSTSLFPYTTLFRSAFRALGHRARLARGRRVVARRSDGGAPGTHGGVPRQELDPRHARRSATRGAPQRVGGDHHPSGGTDRVALPAGHRVRCQGPSGGDDAIVGCAPISTWARDGVVDAVG